jgi:phosphopantothenate-cysteine ligase/phosphopantothenoylcysteine decarboxylase/phosphopantothenate--cysteine ligase
MRLLITAGPTREPIDPVRYLSNRSSGRMGYALAEAALKAGHEVVLVSGPVSLPPPKGAVFLPVETARQMYDTVGKHLAGCELAIFAAAVSDYRPKTVEDHKIKKTAKTLTLKLERTEDVLGSARPVFGFSGILVGFAAETENLLANAQAKLKGKQCDLIIANDISRPGIGFDSEENAVTLCFADGTVVRLPRQLKTKLASALLAEILPLAKKKKAS